MLTRYFTHVTVTKSREINSLRLQTVNKQRRQHSKQKQTMTYLLERRFKAENSPLCLTSFNAYRGSKQLPGQQGRLPVVFHNKRTHRIHVLQKIDFFFSFYLLKSFILQFNMEYKPVWRHLTSNILKFKSLQCRVQRGSTWMFSKTNKMWQLLSNYIIG